MFFGTFFRCVTQPPDGQVTLVFLGTFTQQFLLPNKINQFSQVRFTTIQKFIRLAIGYFKKG